MGPLRGIRILELAGIGPGPFAGMMLADMGAELIRFERPGQSDSKATDTLARNRRSIACDLKNPASVEVVLRLVDQSDGIFEGFRPGVAERLGLGPEICLKRNPKLVYGRMTGWGQEGPLARAAGHDLNYIALSGALHSIGTLGQKPVPPLNLIGDFGGGGMLLAYGMVCALYHAMRNGMGQVVDAAMVDGASLLMAAFYGLRDRGLHNDETGSGFLGGEAHYYQTYETRDNKYVSIASVEPQFYDLLIEKAGLDRAKFAAHGFDYSVDDDTRASWADLTSVLEAVFRSKTRDEWCEIMEGTDVCFAPVLSLSETSRHPHHIARNAFVDVAGQTQPAPAPRFSETPAEMPEAPVMAGAHSREILANAGFTSSEISSLIECGAIVQAI